MQGSNLNPGDIIGSRYQIIEELGRGFYGQTYLAKDLHQPSRPSCVVKQLQPMLNAQQVWQQATERFDNEAKTLEILGIHNQIPQLFAHFEENQGFYLVQQLIEGQDLSKELKQRKRLNEDEVIRLLQDVLEVLIYVHQNNVIHRDIKPSNLIRRQQDGKICLIDFGNVKEIVVLSVNAEGQTFLTQPIGTPNYTPPEQAIGKPNPNSDIYALGVTAIEALIGKIPEQLHTGEFTWEEGVNVSPRFKAILNKMVLKDAKKRYESALLVYSELHTLKSSIKNPLTLPRLFALMGVGAIVGGLIAFLIPHLVIARADRIFNQANELFDSGEYQRAIQFYEEVIKLNPNDYQALINMGNAYSNLQQYPESLKVCEKAIQIKSNEANKTDGVNVDEAKAWNCKALAHKNMQQYPEALEADNKAIKLTAKPAAGFWNSRGDTQLKLKQYDKAISDFETAILLDEKDPLNWFNKGTAFFKAGKYAEAIPYFDRAVNIDPNYHYAATGRGNTLRFLQKYEESIAAYDRAIQIAPKNYEAWYGKCLSLEKLGRNEQAIESCNQAIQIDPKNPAAIDAKQRLQKN